MSPSHDSDASAAAARAMAVRRNPTVEAEDAQAIALFKLGERLTVTDRALLKVALNHPIDVDIIVPTPSAYTVLWLVHYDLIATWIDARDRIWIRTTVAGAMLVTDVRKKRKRDRSQRATP